VSKGSVFILGTTFLFGTIAGHAVILDQVPKRAIGKVIDRIAGPEGEGFNTLRAAPPITPSSRRVVRPSPDLIYSVCAYNTGAGPVEINMSPSEGYYSLSLYDSQTNTFFVVNDIMLNGQGANVTVSAAKGEVKSVDEDSKTVSFHINSPTEQGVALIRRLATPRSVLEAAIDARKLDKCEIINSSVSE
jgi:uncharacterized membrane protein